jgi:hypothetical protein
MCRDFLSDHEPCSHVVCIDHVSFDNISFKAHEAGIHDGGVVRNGLPLFCPNLGRLNGDRAELTHDDRIRFDQFSVEVARTWQLARASAATSDPGLLATASVGSDARTQPNQIKARARYA